MCSVPYSGKVMQKSGCYDSDGQAGFSETFTGLYDLKVISSSALFFMLGGGHDSSFSSSFYRDRSLIRPP